MGDVDDIAAPLDGTGGYAMIPAFKRMIMHLFALNNKLPTSLGRKGSVESLAVVLSTEQENYLSLQYSRIQDVVTKIDQLLGRIPTLGLKAADASISVSIANQPVEWENIGIIMDIATGQMLSETERSSTGATRTRTWTNASANGQTVSTASAWVVQ
jgi:hypothetical protein